MSLEDIGGSTAEDKDNASGEFEDDSSSDENKLLIDEDGEVGDGKIDDGDEIEDGEIVEDSEVDEEVHVTDAGESKRQPHVMPT